MNYKGSLEEAINTVRNSSPDKLYPGLPQFLNPHVQVLEVGCGTGWLSNSINFLYHCPVVGIDFNPVAIERAQEIVNILKLRTKFLVQDLFLYEPNNLFDVVISFGVLHHTNNCEAAIRLICEKAIRPGGHLMIGLYHKYGRQPFLDYFNEMKKRGATEQEMLSEYKTLHSQIKDETQLFSWFRDQVLIPYETQHTLEEMLPVLEESGMDLVSTSINHFQPIKSIGDLINEEKKYSNLATQRLKQNRYFPGFFSFVARKKSQRSQLYRRKSSLENRFKFLPFFRKGRKS